MEPIQKKQITLINVALHDLGIPREEYYDILWQQFEVKSCKSLSEDQAKDLLRHFRSLGWEPKKKSPSPTRGEGEKTGEPASPKRTRRPQEEKVKYIANHDQKWKLIRMFQALGWISDKEISVCWWPKGTYPINTRIACFIQSQTKGKKANYSLSSDEISDIIEALKKMLEGGRGERREMSR